MKDKDVIEGNNAIDDFYYGKELGKCYHYLNHYHKHWNLLMPVVEKIGEDYEFMIDTYAGVEVSKKPMQSFLWIDRDESIPLIQQTWQAVVQFIQWYNQTKQQ